MKKLAVLFIGLCVFALPARAHVNFYRAPNGQIVLEATDCRSAQRILSLVQLPDDPPTKPVTPDDTPDTDNPDDDNPDQDPAQGDDPAAQADPNVVAGVQSLAQALLGDDEEPARSARTATDEPEEWDFEDRQETLITFVRDVNWKTGLKLTFRDMSFFRRLKMACTGVTQLTKPLRVSVESTVGDLDSVLDKASDKLVESIANAARSRSFDDMAKLSVLGLVDAVEQKNPFYLLLVDEGTYDHMVELEPQVKDLFENMYTFFKIRSVLMEPEFDQNIKALIRVAKIGKGDEFGTWKIMAQYAQRMLQLERGGKLSANDEKESHIWRLESFMHKIKEQVRIEERAAELLAQDPQYKGLIEEAKQSDNKSPSLDSKALKLLEGMTEQEKEQLIYKHYGK